MAWLDPAWQYRLPVTIDNAANATSALSHHQVAVKFTGSSYASWAAHGLSSGADIRVADADGTTLIPHWLEGIDPANSAVYLMVKVPRVAASATRTIYVYWGNAAATTVSSAATTIRHTTAITGPNDLVDQADLSGYSANPIAIGLKYQTGGNASHNGEVLVFFPNGTGHASGDKSTQMLRSTDGGVTFTRTEILTPAAGNNAEVLAAGEMTDGSIVLCYTYDITATRATAKVKHYVARSTDAGATWTNLSTTPANQMSLPWTVGSDVGLAYGTVFEDAAGNILMGVYGKPSAAARHTQFLLRCASGSDPTNGSNWTTLATVATHGTLSFGECAFILSADGSHWIAVIREVASTYDLYTCTSPDATGAGAWSTPTRLGMPNPALGTQPGGQSLLRLDSGNILLSYNLRATNSATSKWGSAHALSTDDGFNWLDRPPVAPMSYTAGTTAFINYGYPSSVQLTDGTIVSVSYRDAGGVDTTNIARAIFDEDYVANGNNVYINCESFDGNWKTHQAQVTTSTTHVHNGSNAIKFDNSAGTGVLGEVYGWPKSSDGHAALRVAHSHWCYITQVPTSQNVVLGRVWDSSATPATRFTQSVLSSPYPIEWHDSTVYHDTGGVAALNQWQKITSVYATTPTTAAGSIWLNDTLVSDECGQWQAGSYPSVLAYQAGSFVTTNACTMWVDDIYTHQYTANPPASTLGAEQQHESFTYVLLPPSPHSGPVGSASAAFTVTPAFAFSGTITITPSGGGLSAPIVLTFSLSDTAQTFTITPSEPGLITLTSTNSVGMTNPDPVTYTSTPFATCLVSTYEFDASRSALMGYTVYSPSGAVIIARSTAGIARIGNAFVSEVAIPWIGAVVIDWDDGINHDAITISEIYAEPDVTVIQAIGVILAMLRGKTLDGGLTFLAPDDVTPRNTGTVAGGDRTSSVMTPIT